MSTYIILNVYLQYFIKTYNELIQLKMVSQRDRISREFVFLI